MGDVGETGGQNGDAKLSGRELLRNFQCRRDLGLLPGQPPLAAVMPTERRTTLREHAAFGYDSGTSAAPEASSGTADAALAELEARREALQAQLAEIEGALEVERAKGGQVGEQIESMQEAMAATVDEHGTLSRSLAEAQSRSAELQREADRLQVALQERGESEEAPEEREPEPVRSADLARAGPEGPYAADLAAERSAKTAIERLALHRAFLLQLDDETRELRERCAEEEARLATT
uniref:Uncharacterized protein n=1 Tax=Alexandrium catenella TaxID=2925 RepID=A0A7S1WMQ8_ALECA|mmetsp:Transcript_74575/g.198115  ORF Transcript_74575/g.198115 Transcript_74575/m.198115 type:complete len:237 (+) Transcript_74575:45-755(+)